MTKTIKQQYQSLATNRFITRSPIRAFDWKDMHHSQNLLYSRHAERITGVTYDPFLRIERQSAYVNEGTFPLTNNKKLNSWQPIFRPHRYGDDGNFYFSVQVYGRNIDYRFEIQNMSTGTVLLTGNVICDENSDWYEEEFFLTLAEVWDFALNEPKPLRLIPTGARNIDAGTEQGGDIFQVDVWCRFLEAEELPTENYVRPIDFGGMRVFSTCGATGRIGPTQSQADTFYEDTNLEGEVEILGSGLQRWVVPFNGRYEIVIAGSEGGEGISGPTPHGGRGAIVSMEYDLFAGQQLLIVVGQRGQNIDNMASGGGGSLVERTTPFTILGVAGGGGGYAVGTDGGGHEDLCDANDIEDGDDGLGNSSFGVGGSGGTGGFGADSRAAGGAGYFSGGQGIAGGGTAFEDGAIGGEGAIVHGGFGGGGAITDTASWRAGAGGGGYSGGGGGFSVFTVSGVGGGGGSFVDSNAINSDISIGANGNFGDGYVTIDLVTLL